ncbi:MAG: hypothetical protein R3279_02590 [Putridiphycobacter sp.]|nr:hypothetical protein [Putridiphycobacter sp.]
MKSVEANKKVDALIAAVEKEFNAEKIIDALKEIREYALKETDPLLAKVCRLSYEYIAENDCFDHTVEKEEDEEGEEYLLEPGTDAENFTYLLQLIRQSENDYNREEIKEMRTWLKQKLY